MRLTPQNVLNLARLDASGDVLSVYARTTPDRQAHSDPDWEVAVRSELRTLAKRVKEEGPRERRMALDRRLGTLEGQLDEFLDPAQSGRGRALFAPLDSEDVHTVFLQMPLPDAVVLSDRPHVRPLVAALDEGRPVGVVLADRSGARVLEWAFGAVEEVATFDFFEYMQGKRLEGPAQVNPALGQQSSTQSDRYDERRDEHVVRFLGGEVSEGVRRRIADRNWQRMVVAGQAPFATPLVDAFPDGVRVVRTEHEFMRSSTAQIAEAIGPLLSEEHRQREQELAEQVVETALGRGHATVGVEDILGVLQEGRVRHLVFDEDLHVSGYRSADWVVRHSADGEAEEEPDLVERMVERALDTGAEVSPVSGPAAEVLSPHEGVGALLRW